MKKFSRNSFVLLCCLTVFLCVSCHSKYKDSNSQYVLSLKQRCEDYAVKLKTDTLRRAADKLLQVSEPYTPNYFRAIHFSILSDFNTHDYAKVLKRIDETFLLPHFTDYPDIVCRYLFTRARCYQYTQQYNSAVAAFKQCIRSDAADDSMRENIRKVVVEAMLQMLNTCQSAGKPQECSAVFDTLLKSPPPLIRKYCMRDLYSISAYSFCLSDDMKRAISNIEQAYTMPLYKSTPQRLFRDYSYGAAIFYGIPSRQKQIISLCQQAMKIGFTEENISGTEWITSTLGEMYRNTGDIGKAISLFRFCAIRSRAKGNLNGEAQAYRKLTDIYLSIDMFDKANELVDKAIEKNLLQKDHNPKFCGEAYMTKGEVMMALNRFDSAFHYLNLSDSCFKNLPYLSGKASLNEDMGIALISRNHPGDLQKGIDRLRYALSNPTDESAKARIFLELSKGLFKQNKIHEGEVMLDSMYNMLHPLHSAPVYIDGAYYFAFQHFIQTHNTSQIVRYADAFLEEYKAWHSNEVNKKIIQFTLREETEKQSQQLQLTNSQLRSEHLQVELVTTILFILVFLIIAILYYFLNKRRNYKLRQELMEERFTNLSNKLLVTSLHSKEVEEKLSELLLDIDKKRQIAAITPDVYRESGEAAFRSRMSAIYPSFLPRLRERVPGITHNEEILCMLIALDQTTEQILEIFCIARGSLNMARYRLRQKMQLCRDDSLEDIIKKMLE